MAAEGSGRILGRAALVLFGLVSLGFWVVGVGVGWRAWILLDDVEPGRGIVAHAAVFGGDALAWWVPASVLTLTTVVIAVAVSAQGLIAARATTTPSDDESGKDEATEQPESTGKPPQAD